MVTSLEILRPYLSTAHAKPVFKESDPVIEKHLEELSYQSLKLINDQDFANWYFSKHIAASIVVEHSFA